jgi:hypothetical protein
MFLRNVGSHKIHTEPFLRGKYSVQYLLKLVLTLRELSRTSDRAYANSHYGEDNIKKSMFLSLNGLVHFSLVNGFHGAEFFLRSYQPIR